MELSTFPLTGNTTVAPIGQEVGVVGEIAINGNGVARVIRAAAFRGGLRGGTSCTGEKDVEVGPVVSGDARADLRQFVKRLRFENGALLAGFGLQQRGACIFHCDYFLNPADLEGGINGDNGNLQDDGTVRSLLKPSFEKVSV